MWDDVGPQQEFLKWAERFVFTEFKNAEENKEENKKVNFRNV